MKREPRERYGGTSAGTMKQALNGTGGGIKTGCVCFFRDEKKQSNRNLMLVSLRYKRGFRYILTSSIRSSENNDRRVLCLQGLLDVKDDRCIVSQSLCRVEVATRLRIFERFFQTQSVRNRFPVIPMLKVTKLFNLLAQ